QIAVKPDPAGGLKRAAIRASVGMNQAHSDVFAALAELIARDDQVTAAVQGMRVLPRTSWPKDRAGATAKTLASWAKAVPEGSRSGLEFAETVQLADDLAGFLPADQATALRRELRGLRVATFVIRTVREQMRYDTPRLVVEAGKTFELIVENGDFMPHNLVIVKPGAREKVGVAASTMRPDQLDNRGRAYVPRGDDVIAATRLLEAGQKETLKVTAPTTEGDHEYVCTFPGHHQVMWGWLIVTKDVDAYLAAHPEAKPAGGGSTDHSQHHGLE
ncbi:MAG: plastocyanin/azurin family copper-binding protein, partial [Nitrospira sp.]|nr:plastocyanin/azurin family copper-binding protein [Nitrospira sp.]